LLLDFKLTTVFGKTQGHRHQVRDAGHKDGKVTGYAHHLNLPGLAWLQAGRRQL
jgi:hypothetical protein